MAQTNKVELKINVRKQESVKSPGYGKWYCEVDANKTLSLRGLAQHIIDHGSVLDLSTIVAVLTKISQCIPELVSQGTPVKLDGLGTFTPRAETIDHGFTDEQLENLNPNDVVEGIHIRFYPDQSALDNISSRVFKEKCALKLNNVVQLEKKTEGGKVVATYKTFMPVADYVAKQHEQDEPEP